MNSGIDHSKWSDCGIQSLNLEHSMWTLKRPADFMAEETGSRLYRRDYEHSSAIQTGEGDGGRGAMVSFDFRGACADLCGWGSHCRAGTLQLHWHSGAIFDRRVRDLPGGILLAR